MTTTTDQSIHVPMNVWTLIIMHTNDHKPWRSTVVKVFTTSSNALTYLKKYVKEDDEDDEEEEWTLENYESHLPDHFYCEIEEVLLDDEFEGA